MLSFGSRTRREPMCDGVSRRAFLRIGALGLGGITLADLLRLEARGAARPRSNNKAVIMVFLQGGPSHLDIYDLKPDAPAEIRGEHKPIATNVNGFQFCEHLPLQAKIADKLALIRNMTFDQGDHAGPGEIETGFVKSDRPSIGSVLSRLQRDKGVIGALPPYVSFHTNNRYHFPGFLGSAHRPFRPGDDLDSLELAKGMTLDRLGDRKQLLGAFDSLRRDLDAGTELEAMDGFTAQALEMIMAPTARDAFDISKESPATRAKYGPHEQFLQARRLVEAGVKVVTLTFIGVERGRKKACGFGGGTWDTHGNQYKCLGHLLPQLDQAVHALVTDLHDRGLEKDVAVYVGGEFGRTPRITPNPNRKPGRGHWPQAGFALLAGGGLSTGQVIGATDARGGLPLGRPYKTQNILATLYKVLGIDPETTIPDHQGRPIYLLDDRRPIQELV